MGAEDTSHKVPASRRPKTEYVLLAALVAIAIGIVISGVIFFRSQSANVTAQANNQLSSIADLKVRELEDWRSERLGDAETLAQNAAFATLAASAIHNPSKPPVELESWMQRLRQGDNLERVVLFDPTGRVVLSVPSTGAPVSRLVARAVPGVVTSGLTRFVDFNRNEFDQRVYAGTMVPITDSATHKRLGVVYLRIDPEARIYPYLERWPVPSASGESLLVRKDGGSALFLNPLRFDAGAALKRRASIAVARPTPAAKAVTGFEGAYRGPDYRAVDVFSAIRRVPGTGWYLVAKENASEALAPLDSRFWQILLLMAASLVAVAMGIAYTRRLGDARQYQERLAVESERSWLFDVLASSSNEIYVFDATTLEFTFVNDSALEHLGYGSDEMKSMTPIEVEPDFLDKILGALPKRGEADGVPELAVETFHRRKDGSEYPVMVEYRRMHTGSRDVYLSVADDITARKLAEEGLRRSEERYRSLVEQASDGIFLADMSGQYVDVNAAGATMLGYTHDEILSKKLVDLVDPTDVLTGPLRIDEMRAGKTVVTERRMVRKDGTVVPVEISGRMTASGHLQAIVRDISDRMAAESALRESAELLTQSQRVAAVGHYVLDVPSGRWTSSEVLDELFGIGPKYDRSVAGWLGIVHPDDREAMETYLTTRVLGRLEPFDREYRIVRADDGDARWVRGVGRLDLDADGQPVRMFGVIQDITKRKLAEIEVQHVHDELEQLVTDRTAQLSAANKELEAFSYSVSHDLRAPLRHISGFVELLGQRERDRLDETGVHYLDVISEAVRQMGTLIDDLLEFSRLGRAEVVLTEVDMDAQVLTALEPLESEIDGRAVEWDIAPLPRVRGDASMLRRVWANLLGNAIKYTRTRNVAHIGVGSYEEGGETVFFVRDDGVGFDMEYAGKLFGVFQRMHSASDFEGTGIGLANVKRVVTRLGGRVWAEAEVDKGATFYFSIPAGGRET
jgi:PAS domain S-box-containing protein